MKYKTLQHPRIYWFFHDSGVLIKRSITHMFKHMDQLLGLFVQPIMFMLLFRYVFGGAIQTGGTSYVNYLVAGILVQTIAFGSMTTSFAVATDLSRGIIDRFKSLPMFSGTVLIGHVTADLLRNVIASTVMILVGLAVGFRPVANVTDWVLIIGMILLFSFAISWVGAILGLLARAPEAVQWMGFFVIFPLTFASSAFVPTEGMPGPLRAFAENQPVTHVIGALRSLMVGTPMGDHAWLALIWCLAVIIISIPLTAYLFRTRT